MAWGAGARRRGRGVRLPRSAATCRATRRAARTFSKFSSRTTLPAAYPATRGGDGWSAAHVSGAGGPAPRTQAGAGTHPPSRLGSVCSQAGGGTRRAAPARRAALSAHAESEVRRGHAHSKAGSGAGVCGAGARGRARRQRARAHATAADRTHPRAPRPTHCTFLHTSAASMAAPRSSGGAPRGAPSSSGEMAASVQAKRQETAQHLRNAMAITTATEELGTETLSCVRALVPARARSPPRRLPSPSCPCPRTARNAARAGKASPCGVATLPLRPAMWCGRPTRRRSLRPLPPSPTPPHPTSTPAQRAVAAGRDH